MFAAFGVFCFVYPFAIVLLSLDLMPFGMEWMSSLLLAMLGIAAGAWVAVSFGWRGGLLAGAIFVLGLALEYIGVTTGIPFGSYSYTGVLVPELPGKMPAAIGFAWVFIVIAGVFTAARLLARGTERRWLVAPVGAVLAVGLDFLLEPVAYHVKGYWQWQTVSSGYYGVPWSNFATWFVAALLLNALVLVPAGTRSVGRWSWLPVALYLMNVVMFGVVNVAHGFWLAGVIALFLLALYWLCASRVRRASYEDASS